MKLTLKNFKSLNYAYDLSGLTVLTGVNGSGKSTIIEAVLIALTGKKPGYSMGGKLYRRLAGPLGPEWSIHLDMGDGTVVSRVWGGNQISVHMTGVESAHNRDHHEAIRVKYPVPRYIDVRGLIAMDQRELADKLVDLCADKVTDDIPGTMVRLEQMYNAEEPGVLLGELGITSTQRTSLGILRELWSAAGTGEQHHPLQAREAIKAMHAANDKMKAAKEKLATVPVAAASADVAELVKTRDAKKLALQELQYEQEAKEARDRVIASASELVEEARAELSKAREEQAARREKLVAALVAEEEAKAKLIPIPEAPSKERLDAYVKALVERKFSDPVLEAQLDEAQERLAAADGDLAAEASRMSELRGVLQERRSLASKLEGGVCPLCSSEVSNILEQVKDGIADTASELDVSEKAMVLLKRLVAGHRSTYKEVADKFKSAVSASLDAKSNEISRLQRDFASAKKAFDEAFDLKGKHAAASLASSYIKHNISLAEADIITKASRVGSLEAAVPAPLPDRADEVAAAELALSAAQTLIDRAAQGAESAASAGELRAEIASLKADVREADAKRKTARALTKGCRALHKVSEELVREVLAGKVGPIADAFDAAWGKDMGRLSITGAGVCFIRAKEVRVHLEDLSDGERLRAALLVISVIAKDGGILVLDKAESLDEVGMKDMIFLLHKMVDDGHFSSIIVARVGSFDLRPHYTVELRVTNMPDGLPF